MDEVKEVKEVEKSKGMKLTRLISEDDIHVSKGSIGIWISILVILTISGLVLFRDLDIEKYKVLASTWSSILMIFAGYKAVDKGQSKFFNK